MSALDKIITVATMDIVVIGCSREDYDSIVSISSPKAVFSINNLNVVVTISSIYLIIAFESIKEIVAGSSEHDLILGIGGITLDLVVARAT